jgi:hypothetical protein
MTARSVTRTRPFEFPRATARRSRPIDSARTLGGHSRTATRLRGKGRAAKTLSKRERAAAEFAAALDPSRLAVALGKYVHQREATGLLSEAVDRSPLFGAGRGKDYAGDAHGDAGVGCAAVRKERHGDLQDAALLAVIGSAETREAVNPVATQLPRTNTDPSARKCVKEPFADTAWLPGLKLPEPVVRMVSPAAGFSAKFGPNRLKLNAVAAL